MCLFLLVDMLYDLKTLKYLTFNLINVVSIY